jgi:hypothetical protein
MKKNLTTFLILIITFISCSAQDSLRDLKRATLHYHATVNTDSGIQKGFLWQVTDSTILLSNKKKVMSNNISAYSSSIPVENISVLRVRDRRFPFPEMAVGAILGFVLTAGLWENEDVNNDGHLSYWELLYGAVDGISSQGRERRRTAIWAGIGGGAVGLIAGALSNRKLIISLPIGMRKSTYLSNKDKIEVFIR